MPLLTDIGTFMASNGCGTVAVGWGGAAGNFIFEGQMPADCDTGFCLNKYGGAEPDYVLNVAGVYVEMPHFQVYCRHTDFATGEALAETAYQALATIVNQTLTATKYLRVEPLQSPFQVSPPQDAQGRWEWMFNCRAMKALG
jgi:hypothetical protein